MRIVPVPCLKDNYAYLVICDATREATVVDPSQPEPVLEAIRSEGVTLKAIWNTHHHFDHTGGNAGLLERHPDLEVVGHASDEGRIPGQTTRVDEGDRLTVGEEIRAEVLHNPGHTSGAISYYLAAGPGGAPAVFTGDTLFAAGCGRVFEGTPAQMHASLSKLASLGDDTQVYCGHEYTEKNLAFAAEVEPESESIAGRRSAVEALRAAGEPTVPSTIRAEKETNPFLRVEIPQVIAASQRKDEAAGEDPASVFAVLRRWKDSF